MEETLCQSRMTKVCVYLVIDGFGWCQAQYPHGSNDRLLIQYRFEIYFVLFYSILLVNEYHF